jgi:predicted GIY-YIG superfamily endonuclease
MDLQQKVTFMTKQCHLQLMMLQHITKLMGCAPQDLLEDQIRDVEASMSTTHATPSPYFPMNTGYIYVLQLHGDETTDSFFYIGYTQNLIRRLDEHFNGHGAEWTKLHRPVRVVEVVLGERADEKSKTLEYMRRHGWARTRGHCWTSRVMKHPPDALTMSSPSR